MPLVVWKGCAFDSYAQPFLLYSSCLKCTVRQPLMLKTHGCTSVAKMLASFKAAYSVAPFENLSSCRNSKAILFPRSHFREPFSGASLCTATYHHQRADQQLLSTRSLYSHHCFTKGKTQLPQTMSTTLTNKVMLTTLRRVSTDEGRRHFELKVKLTEPLNDNLVNE